MSSSGVQFSSVQFSRSVVSDSLQSCESQHARPPCPSPAPGVYSNSCPSSRWCHPAILSSVVAFSSCPQSLPASGSLPIGQLFSGGGQSSGVSTSASVLPKNTQDWSPLVQVLNMLNCINVFKMFLSVHSTWEVEVLDSHLAPSFVSCAPLEKSLKCSEIQSLCLHDEDNWTDTAQSVFHTLFYITFLVDVIVSELSG